MTYKYQSIYLDNPIVEGRVLDIFDPHELTQEVTVFLIHGGGWTGGSRCGYHQIMQGLKEQGFTCISTDYRLGSNNIKVLDQVTDLRHAYDQAVSYLKAKDRPLKIFTLGSSAGAHLTELVSYASPGEIGEELEFNGRKLANEWVKPIGTAPICGPVTFVPWEDIFPGIWSSMVDIAGMSFEEEPDFFRQISPDTYLREGICPSFFICAENEHMFPPKMAEDFVAKINAFGVKAQVKTYKNMEHGFFYHLNRPQQREAFADLIKFIKELS